MKTNKKNPRSKFTIIDRITSWIKTQLGITAMQRKIDQLALQKDELILKMERQRVSFDSHLAELRKFSRMDVDIDPSSMRATHTVILTGVIKGKGYVRFYDMQDVDFASLADHLHHRQKHSLLRHIDEPLGMDFRAMFKL